MITEKNGSSAAETKLLVIDTCSLKFEAALGFILQWIKLGGKVVITLAVLAELEKFRVQDDALGHNIRRLISMAVEDAQSEHFLVEETSTEKYTDDVILNYCRAHKSAVLFTADYVLLLRARAYKVPCVRASESMHSAENYFVAEPSPSYNEEGCGNHDLANVRFANTHLYLDIPNTTRIGYVVLDKDGVCKAPNSMNSIKLELEDEVIVLTYKLKHNGLCVSVYEVVSYTEHRHANLCWAKPGIQDSSAIDNLSLPESCKNKIKNYFNLVRKS